MRFIGFAGASYSGWQDAVESVKDYLDQHGHEVAIENLGNYVGGIYEVKEGNKFILCHVKDRREASFLSNSPDDLLIIVNNKSYFDGNSLANLSTEEDTLTAEIVDSFASSPSAAVISGRGRELNAAAIHAVRNRYLVS